eukprot:1584711-Karenia_brevis.AAC.1
MLALITKEWKESTAERQEMRKRSKIIDSSSSAEEEDAQEEDVKEENQPLKKDLFGDAWSAEKEWPPAKKKKKKKDKTGNPDSPTE